MANIGFVGLGHMGLPMAIQLVKAGHNVNGFDLDKTALSAFAAQGGREAPDLLSAARGQDIIITMLQTGDQVQKVCSGKDGLLANASQNALLIDCSSIDVPSSQNIHALAEQQGLLAVDAPVSGGVKGAQGGTLTFLVGGSEHAFEKAQPILAIMGKKIIHTGVAGSGQVAKICNNMVLGISMIAISEAFVLAERLGLSHKKFFEVVTNASGKCWAMENYAPVPGVLDNVPANNDYKPGFTVAMMLKDLRLSQNSAETAGVNTAMGQCATTLYQHCLDEGMGELDFSAIIKTLNGSI